MARALMYQHRLLRYVRGAEHVFEKTKLKLKIVQVDKVTQMLKPKAETVYFDTGSEFSMIPIPVAKRKGIPFDPQGKTTEITGVNGLPVVSIKGNINVVFLEKSYELPCYFSDVSPDTHASVNVSKTKSAQSSTETARDIELNTLMGPHSNLEIDRSISEQRYGELLNPCYEEALADQILDTDPGTSQKTHFSMPPILIGRAKFLDEFSVGISDGFFRVCIKDSTAEQYLISGYKGPSNINGEIKVKKLCSFWRIFGRGK